MTSIVGALGWLMQPGEAGTLGGLLTTYADA